MGYKGIIISGLPCSGKSVLGDRLRREYGWEKFPFGDILRGRWKAEHPNEDVSFEDWWRDLPIEEDIKINLEGREIISSKSLIVDSRYSAFYCKDLPYFRAYLCADLQIRAKRAAEREKRMFIDGKIKRARSKNELEEVLQKREEDEYKKGLRMFGEDYREAKHYHVCFNTGILSVDQEFNALKTIIGTEI